MSSLEVEAVLDRRRLRRRIAIWRTLALIAIAGIIGGSYLAGGGARYVGESSAHVARVTVGGLIRHDRQRIEMLDRIGRSGAEAVIVTIDSPGGTVVGSESLYESLLRLSKRKPVVAVVNGLAASGGYVAALGTERIFAQRNAIVGSIGVIFQMPNVHALLTNLGISVEAIKSSPLKAEPNPYSETAPEAREAMEALVLDSYDWFRNLVRERRDLDDGQLKRVADGRVFTAGQALPLRLVDEIGGERAAREWLEKNKGVSADLRVRDWREGRIGSRFGWLNATATIADRLGFPLVATLVANEMFGSAAARAQLDGLLALWHPVWWD